MPLSNSFAIDADASPAEVRRVLSQTGYFRDFADYGERKEAVGSGIIITISSPPHQRAALEEAGIEATVGLSMPNNDSDKLDDWEVNCVRAVVALLHAYPGDALFLYCRTFRRLGGRTAASFSTRAPGCGRPTWSLRSFT